VLNTRQLDKKREARKEAKGKVEAML